MQTQSLDCRTGTRTVLPMPIIMTTDLTKSTFGDILLKMSYSVDTLPTCLDYLKTKDESEQNAFPVATSKLVKVGQITHNNIAEDRDPRRSILSDQWSYALFYVTLVHHDAHTTTQTLVNKCECVSKHRTHARQRKLRPNRCEKLCYSVPFCQLSQT